MAGVGASKSSNAPRIRKRVEAETDTDSSPTSVSLKRARDGSAFARCEECKKDVPVVLINMHNCSLEAKIKMNLEAQVVEKPAEVKKKPAEKRKPSASTGKKERKAKDPNKLKRPLSAFFVFMGDFRKTFKEANPDCKSVSMVGKEGGEKWKSMTDEEKQPYVDRAAELKAEYEKALKSHENAENEDGGDSHDEEASSEKQEKVETISDDE